MVRVTSFWYRLARSARQLGRSASPCHIQNSVYFPVPGKPLFWVASTLKDLRSFPERARNDAGQELRRVQNGLEPEHWRPMSAVGAGVIELRIHDQVEHRVFYVAKFSEMIYVLHVFPKKTQGTAQRDLEIGRKR